MLLIILVRESSSSITEHAYCHHCHINLIPEVSKHKFFKIFEVPSLKDLIDNWDGLKLSVTDIDLVGCFLPLCREVNAGPSARCFLVRPIEHPQMAHSHTSAEPEGSSVSMKKNAKAKTNFNRERLVVKKTKT